MQPQFTPPQVSVRIGEIDVTVAIEHVSFTRRLNALSQASFRLSLDRLPSSAVDLANTVQIWQGNPLTLQFTGVITGASYSGGKLQVEAKTGLELTDSKMGRMVSYNLPAIEMIRTLLKTAGLSDEQFNLEGLAVPAQEYFEVLVPVSGLDVRQRTYTSNVALLPLEVVKSFPRLSSLSSSNDDFRLDFMSSQAYMLLGVLANFAIEAEQLAFERAGAVLASMAVAARASVAVGPDGAARAYSRSDARVVPVLRRMASVRGASSGRGWIRDVDSPLSFEPMRIEAATAQFHGLPGQTPEDLVRTAQSLYRSALSGSDLLGQNLALWDAIEFYAAAVSSEPLFSRKDHRQLLRQVISSSNWTASQRKRLLESKQYLNSAPLMWRLRQRFVLDRVPFTDGEFDTLAELRTLRNRAVHGGAVDASVGEQIRSGVHLMSRAVLYSTFASASRSLS